ncbi:malate synthase G [Pelagibacteraceae bacterium]|jgi:malate synthase|nr:malate synthase G [Pelagibacteraceae bacterium]|tara:strand:- start:4902 stop:7049 length:2148 start_codon:yes stop_codon:yes gene_type:complete
MNTIKKNGLRINSTLFDFINKEAIPETNVDPEVFWLKFEEALSELSPLNKKLLDERENIQKKIDAWHIERSDKTINKKEYIKFLKDINYIVEEKDDFVIETSNVDSEISSIAGPQLVVPVDNARYALNAANARWGSFYDALYGTDIIPGKKDHRYDPIRGKKVISYVRNFLENVAPIKNGSWKKISKIIIKENNLIFFIDNNKYYLEDKRQFIGYNGEKEKPSSILIKNNNLHIDIIINEKSVIGKDDDANISDVIIESAVSTIVDNEDSVAAVDAEDKVKCYRNWLGLMKADLKTEVIKDGKKFIRKLNLDRSYIGLNGFKFKLHGRALLLNRNVGHLMTNPAIILKDGSEIPEGIMDAFVSTLCALHDFKNKNNSRTNSVYIVKPKMHGPEEVGFTNILFGKVEEVLGVKKYSIKVGIMDEERRTTVNLKECIRKVKERIVFINTGFLDRTGDEMHTSFEAGPMIFKGDMKKSTWLNTYEDWNVDVGLSCGFSGKAQIGKGMWAMPDRMSDMMVQKIGHPKSGANCAWVPSPTAATLHATHYHKIDVFKKQLELKSRNRAKVEKILEIPIADRPNWSVEDINKELENNAQGIFGYVVRWVDQGVGCSKVPDINNIGLMEDRATLRISSQHMANWLYHGVCNKEQVMSIMKKMARIVDKQNENDQDYKKMSDDFEGSIAFSAACDLVFKGRTQPSGYTEPLLHKKRLEKKTSKL